MTAHTLGLLGLTLMYVILPLLISLILLRYKDKDLLIKDLLEEIGEDKKRKLKTARGILYQEAFYPKHSIQILDSTVNFVKLPSGKIVPLKDCEIVLSKIVLSKRR